MLPTRTVFVLAVLGTILLGCASARQAPSSAMAPMEEIVNHPHSKDKAFTRAQRWAAQTFVSANEVIQMEDRESGTLVMKGVRQMPIYGMIGEEGFFNYTLTLDIRDQKMRITYDLEGWSDFPRDQARDVEKMKEYYENELKPSLLSFVREEDDF